MANYRIHLLNVSGKILSGFNATCIDDQEACALAQRMISTNGRAEVWLGKSCVGYVSATSVADIKTLGQF